MLNFSETVDWFSFSVAAALLLMFKVKTNQQEYNLWVSLSFTHSGTQSHGTVLLHILL